MYFKISLFGQQNFSLHLTYKKLLNFNQTITIFVVVLDCLILIQVLYTVQYIDPQPPKKT